MKIKVDTKKGVEAVSGLLQKTSELGKKTIASVQDGANALSEKTKKDSFQRRLKKYNPVFPDVYFSSEFNIPNMIMIRDDAERRGIDVCEGAIGWLGNEGGMEVLYLYDEAVASSGIHFVPAATCDAIYYVDTFDRKRFIRVDCIFSKAHEEKIAELKHIAYALGAKSCVIEISETSTEMSSTQKKTSAGVKMSLFNAKLSSQESVEHNAMQKSHIYRSGKVTAQFEGNDCPKKPKLKWFANEESIKRLIEMRCKGANTLKSETLEISGAFSATMSQKTAYAIDSAIGSMSAKGGSTMESQVMKENQSVLRFIVEF